MSDFINDLMSPDILFLRYALLVSVLSSIAFGIVGTFVIVKRISYIAGAISHCVLGGIGAALYFRAVYALEWLDPMYGAVIAALSGALIIGVVSIYSSQREDTVIGAIWAIGMAVGLLFIAKTPGYIDPMSYLFGDILLITKSDLWFIIGLDIVIAACGIAFYNRLLALCFDTEFAALRGMRVNLYYIIMLCMAALTVVLLVRVVGIVMVIALLTLPSAVASIFSRSLWQMMISSIVLCALFSVTGLAISYPMNLPVGPCIISVAGSVYLFSMVASYLYGRYTLSNNNK
jgi:zinc transport system permease protein